MRSEFTDDDLAVRSKRDDPRGRSVHEHTVHQCASEDAWFRTMLGVDVGAPPLPDAGTARRVHQAICRRQRQAARDPSTDRGEMVGGGDEVFDVTRSKAWVMTD